MVQIGVAVSSLGGVAAAAAAAAPPPALEAALPPALEAAFSAAPPPVPEAVVAVDAVAAPVARVLRESGWGDAAQESVEISPAVCRCPQRQRRSALLTRRRRCAVPAWLDPAGPILTPTLSLPQQPAAVSMGWFCSVLHPSLHHHSGYHRSFGSSYRRFRLGFHESAVAVPGCRCAGALHRDGDGGAGIPSTAAAALSAAADRTSSPPLCCAISDAF